MSAIAVRFAMIALLAASLTPARVLAQSARPQAVYRQNFNAKPGTIYREWLVTETRFRAESGGKARDNEPTALVRNVEAPKTGRRFIGEFGGPEVDLDGHTHVIQSAQLSLAELPEHTDVTVSFDLLILKSWDGNHRLMGPDRFVVSVVGARTLLDTTFSNSPGDESTQDYPKPDSQARTGAISTNTLGYEFYGDSIYRITLKFRHGDESLVLDFGTSLFQGKGLEDESWGLDNVEVKVSNDGPPVLKRVKPAK